MAKLSLSTKNKSAGMTCSGQPHASREYQMRQNQRDIAVFRERMCRLAENLTGWLAGHGVGIILRESVPAKDAVATSTVPAIVLCRGRNYAGFIPQALYSVKGGMQLKGEVCLTVDNPERSPRTEKYMLCMAEHLLSTADWAIHNTGRSPGKGKVLTRELLLVVLAPLFDTTT